MRIRRRAIPRGTQLQLMLGVLRATHKKARAGILPRAVPRGYAQLVLGKPRDKDLGSDRTLDEFVKTDTFFRRCWVLSCQLADYASHLVDGRSPTRVRGGSKEAFRSVAGFAAVYKAALQWFADEEQRGKIPKFVLEAEKYLAEHATGEAIEWEGFEGPTWLRRGPVVARKQGRDRAGSLRGRLELRDAIATRLTALGAEGIREQLQVYRVDKDDARTAPYLIGDEILTAMLNGVFAEELYGVGFKFDMSTLRTTLVANVARILTADGGLHDESDNQDDDRATHTESARPLAELILRKCLAIAGIKLGKDAFRARLNK